MEVKRDYAVAITLPLEHVERVLRLASLGSQPVDEKDAAALAAVTTEVAQVRELAGPPQSPLPEK